MHLRHMPTVNARYWLAIALASLFGTNLGDLYAHDSGLGLIGGVPILAALAAAVFLLECRDAAPRELYYWLVIVIIRTGATNIADWTKHQIPYLVFALILAVLMVALGWASTRDAGPREATAERTRKMPRTGAVYWCAMLTAGVLGTFYGDVCSHLIGQGPASLALGALLAGALALWVARGSRALWLYWLTVAVARTLGTAAGDFLAENQTLHIGLPLSTLTTGGAFLAVLLLLPTGATATHSASRGG